MAEKISDDALLAAYADRGDRHAFSQLVRRHKDHVYRYILGMVRDPELASDLFQDTFLRVINVLQKRPGAYTPQNRFGGWVTRIARNIVLDHMRSRSKWQDISEGDETYWERLPDTEPLADEVLHSNQQRDWLDQFIARLPDAQREVLILRQDTELTFREIADITDVSINTALGRMRYALINLRSMMKEQSPQTAGQSTLSRANLAKIAPV